MTPLRDADAYDAFISYSHATDGELAPAIQRGLRRLACPWNRRRALRMFRDTSSPVRDAGAVVVGRPPAPPHAVLRAAGVARGGGVGVGRTESRALVHAGACGLVMVLTGGELLWSDADDDFDWERSTAVPRRLRGVFKEEPRPKQKRIMVAP